MHCAARVADAPIAPQQNAIWSRRCDARVFFSVFSIFFSCLRRLLLLLLRFVFLFYCTIRRYPVHISTTVFSFLRSFRIYSVFECEYECVLMVWILSNIFISRWIYSEFYFIVLLLLPFAVIVVVVILFFMRFFLLLLPLFLFVSFLFLSLPRR